MADHPEFPNESPATKYIIEQVSRIEDAQACGTGYYRSLGKVLQRLDKTDTVLNQLQQSTTALVKITDSKVIAEAIGEKSDEMQKTLRESLALIASSHGEIIHRDLSQMKNATAIAISEIQMTNNSAKRIHNDLHEQMGATIQRLDAHIKSVNDRIVPPWWKLWAYLILTLIAGFIIGRFT